MSFLRRAVRNIKRSRSENDENDGSGHTAYQRRVRGYVEWQYLIKAEAIFHLNADTERPNHRTAKINPFDSIH